MDRQKKIAGRVDPGPSRSIRRGGPRPLPDLGRGRTACIAHSRRLPMQYVLLIYNDEKAGRDMSEAARQAEWNGYMEFTKDIVKTGHLRGGEALQAVATATSVRVRNGKTLTTDGPFAETKEQL